MRKCSSGYRFLVGWTISADVEGHGSPMKPDWWAEDPPTQTLSILPLREGLLIPWASYLISLKFYFLFCKMNTRMVPASQSGLLCKESTGHASWHVVEAQQAWCCFHWFCCCCVHFCYYQTDVLGSFANLWQQSPPSLGPSSPAMFCHVKITKPPCHL